MGKNSVTLWASLDRCQAFGMKGTQVGEDLIGQDHGVRIVQCLLNSLPQNGVERRLLAVEGSQTGAEDGDAVGAAHGSVVLLPATVHDHINTTTANGGTAIRTFTGSCRVLRCIIIRRRVTAG